MTSIRWKNPITIISIASVLGGIAYGLSPDLVGYYGGMHRMSTSILHVMAQFGLYSLLHGGFLHTLSNVLFFIVIGNMLTQRHSYGYIWGLWIMTTLLVGITLRILSPDLTIGGSGFAMALLAVYTYDFWQMGNSQYKTGIVLIIINILFGLSAHVSLIGHASGALVGALYAISLRGRSERSYF